MAICKYKPKPCSRCGVVIPVGDECDYDGETKTVSHPYECVEEQPGPECYALAQRLHYMSVDAALHQLWSTVRDVSRPLGVDGERLPRAASGEQCGLWEVPTGSEGEE